MGIITLTTDLGETDFYQGALKGSLINLYPSVKIIDISHKIPPFDIQHAAFILRNAYKYFPKKSVHLIGIDSVFNENVKNLAVEYDGHFFVGADSGIFSLIFQKKPDAIVELTILQDLKYLHFPLTDIFSKAAVHLAKGGSLLEIGDPVDEIVDKKLIQPVVEENIIRGMVIHIDAFGNVITNISKELFNQVQKGRNFKIYFRRNETIDHLSWHYNEVTEGEKLCLFGISNFLEIALNKGRADVLLGLARADIVRIEFENK